MLSAHEIERVLAIQAHPDDVDFSAAGTIAGLTDAGVRVSYCLVTDGQAGGFDLSIPRTEMAGIRREEQTKAAAEVILHALLRYDYPMERDDVPVFVIGYSGAGQMAVGAMTYLREWLPGPLYTISLGGIFGSDPGLLATDHLFHFQGANDHALWLRHLGPGRWPIFPTSEYNRAKRQGRISYITPGPMGHTGRGSYLDAKTSLPDGTPLIDRTVELVANIVNGTLEPSASPEEIAQRTMALAAGAEA